MKKFLLIVSGLLFCQLVYAACTTQSLMIGDKLIMCIVCCDELGNCVTTCL